MFDSLYSSQMDAVVILVKNTYITQYINDLFNRHSNSDHVIKTVTYTCVATLLSDPI